VKPWPTTRGPLSRRNFAPPTPRHIRAAILPPVRRRLRALCLISSLWHSALSASTLALPPRPATALPASQLATNAALLSTNLETREAFVRDQILGGNVPGFLRRLCPVTVDQVAAGETNRLTFYVTPDYLALGSDEDYLLMPMTPVTAQILADQTGCMLPTPKMVAAISAQSSVRLAPQPLPPSPLMTTVPVFQQHNDLVRIQRAKHLASQPLGALTAGDKKDVVVTARLASVTNRVAIYGWPKLDGSNIQPLFVRHALTWVDYSHGIRLVSRQGELNGHPTNLPAILADPQLAPLLSDEGVLSSPRYPVQEGSPPAAGVPPPRWPAGFTPGGAFDECSCELHLPDGVRIVINTPAPETFAPNRPVELIFFALPNGNTIEWTIGRQSRPGDDEHFDLQHIGAQTRFLRHVKTNQTLVVAYLENSLKSWPAWRRRHGNAAIPALIQTVRDLFAAYPQRLVLTGHSGGGSLTFGYLEALADIPDAVQRLAFLDSNYAYETTNHFAKLARWLQASDAHKLCVLAYHDSVALLHGKTFVSERGGTWGRSQAMRRDLQAAGFALAQHTPRPDLAVYASANGQIEFLLLENPERKIWHTVQVERNGFIHALLSGTPGENHGYTYLGERAYAAWMAPD